jgi:hypothetical protein
MSKRFRGKSCIQCLTNPSTATGDHVFAREFFPESARADLPKVPACEPCNNEKSRLEHYLTAVLPFGGRHADAHSNLQELVPARLAKNAKLHRELAHGRGIVLTEERPGLRVLAMTLPFDSDRLHLLFGFIAKGLLWHHWAAALQPHHDLKVVSLTKFDDAGFSPFLGRNAKQRVRADLGNGAFCYEGAQGADYPEFSIWKISVFGGLKLCGDPAAPLEEVTGLGIITAERQFLLRPNVIAIFG